ncbi:hypothetical protein FMUND_12390 [Fusarium mundagurra]|uniref:Uncharacterized protein n=1 Tax=Fusarium mundagurra TaxID=1567541 RepID=A0A8H5Y2W6_9HYPO|nr:hypothetical protein FMUND_12390 [Fusarium mundagurra]
MIDSVSHDTSEVLAVTKLDGASSQSPWPDKGDAIGIESYENTKVDHGDDDTADVTGERQDSAKVVATEVGVVKADNQDVLHETINDELLAEVDGALDRRPAQHPQLSIDDPSGHADTASRGQYGTSANCSSLYVRSQNTKGDKKSWTLEATRNLPVSEKGAQHVEDHNDYLHGFQVALELRAKKLGWPEHEQLAAVNTAKMGEEARKKVIDGKHYLNIGYDLVDQLLRDLETTKSRARASSGPLGANQYGNQAAE